MICAFCDGEGGNLTPLQKAIDAQKLATLENEAERRKKNKNSDNECKTVTCKALDGDPIAVADLVIPTHGGARLQLEGSFWVFSVSGGANMIYNRNDHRLGTSLDFTGEISPGLSLGAGASLTVGPLIGWGASSVDDVISGNSVIVSGAAAYEGAATVAVSAPLTGIDSYYGQIPATG